MFYLLLRQEVAVFSLVASLLRQSLTPIFDCLLAASAMSLPVVSKAELLVVSKAELPH